METEQNKFGNSKTANFHDGKFVKQYPAKLKGKMTSKLIQVVQATCLNDLKIPPTNHLEKTPDKLWAYSIAITRQTEGAWRICFNWNEHSCTAFGIEITKHLGKINN